MPTASAGNVTSNSANDESALLYSPVFSPSRQPFGHSDTTAATSASSSSSSSSSNDTGVAGAGAAAGPGSGAGSVPLPLLLDPTVTASTALITAATAAATAAVTAATAANSSHSNSNTQSFKTADTADADLSASQRPALRLLPLRVVDVLLSFLAAGELQRCQLVCRDWHRAALRSSAWKLTLYRYTEARALQTALSHSAASGSGGQWRGSGAGARSAGALASGKGRGSQSRPSTGFNSNDEGDDVELTVATPHSQPQLQLQSQFQLQPHLKQKPSESELGASAAAEAKAGALGVDVETPEVWPADSIEVKPLDATLSNTAATAENAADDDEDDDGTDPVPRTIAKAEAALTDSSADCNSGFTTEVPDLIVLDTSVANLCLPALASKSVLSPEHTASVTVGQLGELPVPGVVLARASLSVPATTAHAALLAVARTQGLRPAHTDKSSRHSQGEPVAAGQSKGGLSSAVGSPSKNPLSRQDEVLSQEFAPYMMHPAMLPAAVRALASASNVVNGSANNNINSSITATVTLVPDSVVTSYAHTFGLPATLANSTCGNKNAGDQQPRTQSARSSSGSLVPSVSDGSTLQQQQGRTHTHYTLRLYAAAASEFEVTAEGVEVPDTACARGPSEVYNLFDPATRGSTAHNAALLAQISPDGAEPLDAAAAIAHCAANPTGIKSPSSSRGVSLRVCSLHPGSDAAELALCRSLLDQQQHLTTIHLDRARLKSRLDASKGVKEQLSTALAAAKRDAAAEEEAAAGIKKQLVSDGCTNVFLTEQVAAARARRDQARAEAAAALAQGAAAVVALEARIGAVERNKNEQEKTFLELKMHRKLLSKEVKLLQGALAEESTRTARLQALLASANSQMG